MGTLADSGLIPLAPLLSVDSSCIAGRSYKRTVILDDASGNPLDPTNLTAVCSVWTSRARDELVLTFNTTIDSTTIDGQPATVATITADGDMTRGLAAGAAQRNCAWELAIFEDGTPDAISWWGLYDSNYTFYARGA